MSTLKATDLKPIEETPPLYRQVAAMLRATIESHHLKTGDTLPSEAEMAAQLGISKPVVRRALDDLAGAGLIVKRTGAATRVA